VEIPTAALGAAVTSLAAGAVAAARALWSYIRSREERCQSEKDQLRAELRAEQQDHLKTLRVYAALQAKLEQRDGGSSNRPPSS
jgi:hypothetical protein